MRKSDLLNFYSNDTFILKDHINLNYLKLTYQRILLKDMGKKYKRCAVDKLLLANEFYEVNYL